MLEQLVTDLRVLCQEVEEGGDLEATVVTATMSRVRAAAPGCTPSQLGLLKGLVDQLMVQTRQARDDVAERLGQIHGGRRALRGYAHLRGAATGQKMFRRA